jgi:6-phosphogluconolactonase
MQIPRRLISFLVSLLVFLLPLLCASKEKKPAPPKQYIAFVGTYTSKTNSKGIYAFRYDAGMGKLTPLGVAAETADPSFLAVHPNRKYLFAVNESGKNSMVSAFALDAKSGKLTLLNQVPALGEDPCYIAFDKTGKYALIANYTSGSIAVFPILADGKLGDHTALVQDKGTLGPNKERQEGPHAHWTEPTPDNRFLLVADLGLDEVLVYKFDAAHGTVSPNEPPFAKLHAGAGPRHIAMDPKGKFVFVASELNSTVTAFSFNALEGSLKQIKAVTTLPSGFSGRNDVAEIALHPKGKFLYVSNRGNDSIAIFSVASGKRILTPIGTIPTGGKEPRHFALDPSGNFLFAENQFSDSIVVFHVDAVTGQLTPTGDSVSVPSPVCMVFVPAE